MLPIFQSLHTLSKISEGIPLKAIYSELSLLKPKPLKIGDTIGLFTPSWPGTSIIEEKYLHSISEIKRIGFKVIEGKLTHQRCYQGYRTANAKERARELMELISNPEIHAIMATIGGWNSSSLIPYLDFAEIRKQRKIICGYSDLTALHFAILKYSGLSTFYGPCSIPSFGEYPQAFSYTLDSFLNMASYTENKELLLKPPSYWSNQLIDATDKEWKNISRKYKQNEGWQILIEGETNKRRALIANLETLLSFAGTDFFPDVTDCILILEETDASFSKMERNYRQLSLMSIFDKIGGLIISKPHYIDQEGCKLSRENILQEVIGFRNYPIITQFDCGHTFPMITLVQNILMSIQAKQGNILITIDESTVED